MTKPTPGHWRAGEHGDRVIYAGLQPIGSAYLMDDSKVPYEVQKANAVLMAAAPELLAAAHKSLLAFHAGRHKVDPAVVADAETACRDILTRLGELTEPDFEANRGYWHED